MKLLIDIGNSFVKFGIDNGRGTIEDISNIVYENEDALKKIVFNYLKTHSFSSAILVSVSIEINFQNFYPNSKIFCFDHQLPIPIQNLYATPHTLGIDRLAAALGGYSLYPNSELLIIDAGSAITIDRLTANADFIGGNISPGIRMRFKSLNTFTKRLPLIEDFKLYESDFGKSTHHALNHGVIFGVVYELESYVQRFHDAYPVGKVILTGGDAEYLHKILKLNVEVNKNLVFLGLSKALDYNLRN